MKRRKRKFWNINRICTVKIVRSIVMNKKILLIDSLRLRFEV